ncbi:MAG: hypothetical protein ACI4J3_08645 [Oscillospiraceae bacterium]
MKKRMVFTSVSLLTFLTFLLCVASVTARYLTIKEFQNEVYSDPFYFTSNFLKPTEENAEYRIIGNTVTFSIHNYIDSLRITESDITYQLTADAGTLSDDGGILAKDVAASDNIILTYDFAEGEMEKTITVTANSTEQYAQTLQAKFILQKEVLQYEIKDVAGRYYAELYIYMKHPAKTMTLNWDNTVILIDETNDFVFGKLNSEKDSVTIDNIAEQTTVRIVFFKKDITQNYTHTLSPSDGTITLPITS